MSTPSIVDQWRSLYSADTNTLGMGCLLCPILSKCGGLTHERGWSCEPRCSECTPETCDLVCVGKPKVLVEALREIRTSFGWEDIGLVSSPGDLPTYIPTIYHSYRRRLPLTTPWAAIPLRSALRRLVNNPVPAATTPEGLREKFGLSPDTKLLLLGSGEDRYIERYWKWHTTHTLAEALSHLGWSAGVAPNFSFFRDDPPPQKLHNRKRTLMCAEEWNAKGILSVPCLLGLTHADYGYWLEFLEAHPETTAVGKEFQTGLGKWEAGISALEAISRIQDRLKRPLHFVAVGGAQYRSEISGRFESWTLIDSVPFMKSVNRQSGIIGERRIHWTTYRDADLDELLFENLSLYREWLMRPSIRAASKNGPQVRRSAWDDRQCDLPFQW